jgi:hypothetical protein
VEQLLREVCVQLGFCLDPADNARLIAHPPDSVDEFTDAVLSAEGLEWPLGGDHRAALRKLVARAYQVHSPFKS